MDLKKKEELLIEFFDKTLAPEHQANEWADRDLLMDGGYMVSEWLQDIGKYITAAEVFQLDGIFRLKFDSLNKAVDKIVGLDESAPIESFSISDMKEAVKQGISAVKKFQEIFPDILGHDEMKKKVEGVLACERQFDILVGRLEQRMQKERCF